MEIQSEQPGVTLDHFYLLIMDFSKNGVFPPALKLRGAVKLNGQMTDNYGYIGKSHRLFFDYMDNSSTYQYCSERVA